jgi:DNA-binding MarR family transcriptional regulator
MSREDDVAAVDRALTRIGRVANSRRAARHRSRMSGVDLLPTAVATLAAVYRLGPVRLTDVAAEMDLEPSRVSKEVNRLVDGGLVDQAPDPSDRRASLLTITDSGADAWKRYRAAVDEQLTALLADWNDRDLHKLATLLDRLATTVGGDDT